MTPSDSPCPDTVPHRDAAPGADPDPDPDVHPDTATHTGRNADRGPGDAATDKGGLAPVAELISRASLVMWDFDGPLCHLFGGLPAPLVAAELRGFATGSGLDTRTVEHLDDPLDIYATLHRLFAETRGDTVAAVRSALDGLEVRAARQAVPTRGARALLERLRSLGVLQIVVSNNSRGAVTAHLREHGLGHFFAEVVGRPGDPEKMKPHPHSLEKALDTARVDAADSLMIGDSAADAWAAAKVGAEFVGYCTQQDRRAALRAAEAKHLTDDLTALASAVETVAVETVTVRGRHTGPSDVQGLSFGSGWISERGPVP